MSFFAELKRRNVVKVGIAYVVASWLLLQLTEVLTELLELDTDVGKIVILLLIIGFIPALIFAWAFELTPEGIKRDHEVDRTQSITKHTGRKLDFAIIGMLVLIAGYFIWESRFMDRSVETAPAEPAAVMEAAPSQPAAEAPTPAPEAVPATDSSSIAVLPFANRSFEAEDSFFTDGIHDDLLTQLAKIDDLKVVSRTSVMKYKDTEKTIPEIAGELGVGTILEGGVQRAGKRIRINAQLIDVENDEHLWAETFDREMTVENIFDIQSEITRQIVQAVRGELTEEETLKLARVPTNNLQAYEAYLQALAYTNRSDYAQENYQAAEVWAQQAVELDPEFAQAWAMLVELHGQAAWIGYDNTPERRQAAAEALANAERYGPDLPETIAARAEYTYRIDQNFSEAVEYFKRAHQAIPGDVDILHRLGVAQRRTPDVDGALASFRRALEIDPNHGRSANTIAETLLVLDRTEELARDIDRWLIAFPDSRDMRIWRANLYLQQGDIEGARVVTDAMGEVASSAYFFWGPLLPYAERDYEAQLAVWDDAFMTAFSGNRGFLGLREMNLAFAHDLAGNPEASRAEAEKGLALLEAVPDIGGYSQSMELGTRAMLLTILDRDEEAIAAANDSLNNFPESQDPFFGGLFAQSRAHVLGLAGAREQSLAEIERLLNTPYRFSKWLLYLDPRWDFFRDDERFNDLIRPEGVE